MSRAAPAFAGSGLLASLFMIAAIAMVGLPPLSGFLGKIMILQSLYAHWPLAFGAILGGTLMTMLGLARAGSALFWRVDLDAPALRHASPRGSLAAIWLLVGAIIALTLWAGPLTGWLAQVAAGLLNPAPYIAVQSLPQVQP